MAISKVVQDSINGGVAGTGPAFSAYQSSSQSITAGSFTKVQFQTEEFDTNNCFDNTTNYRFQPTVAGYYQISGSVAVGVSACYVLITIYKNGSEFKRVNYSNPSSYNGMSGSALVYLNGSTDYVEFYTLIQTTQILNTSSSTTYFQGALVRAA